MCFASDNRVCSMIPQRMVLAAVCALLLAGSDAFDRLLAAEEAVSALAVKSPISAAESLKHFQLHPALRIELVAAEPDVVDPVAIAFDEDGRLWVAEMRDYPNGPAEGESPKSRIRLLEDRDHDGRFEVSHVFADNLLFANSVMPWRGGVIVTMAGQIAFFRDTDGDGKADHRETWFTGFAQENPQLRANHPTFALDNHIYVANGLRGGTVIAKKTEWSKDAKPVSISSRDFCFDPLGGTYEAVSGFGQFGLTFDDFGNRFVCSNRNPCKHTVLEDRYIKRNPLLAVRSVAHDVSPVGAQSRVFAISRAWTTSTLHAGQFTAACGVTIYRGDALPAEFRGNSFTCEPTGNLVHRDVLQPSGATFSSRPGRQGIAFLASPDEWFRAVNLAHGPDGALYVVDMYRAVIEHPQFMPAELKQRPDLNLGNDRGRIYRILPASQQRSRKARLAPQLSKASSAELVKLLEHRNSWHRETAARLLYERQDRTVRKQLEQLAVSGPAPYSRVQALWVLKGLGQLSQETVFAALGDPHPRVREQAVRLSEEWLNENAEIHKRLLDLAKDADARLRFQVVLSLGEDEAARMPFEAPFQQTQSDRLFSFRQALSNVAIHSADDPWTRKAIASSAGQSAARLFPMILKSAGASDRQTPGLTDLLGEFAEIVGSGQQPSQVKMVLEALNAFPRSDVPALRMQFRCLEGLASGLRRRGKTLGRLLTGTSSATDTSAIFEKAVAVAGSKLKLAGLGPDNSVDLRLQAIAVLRYAGPEIAVEPLKELVANEPSQPVKLAAIGTLSAFHDPAIGATLLANFASETPAVRRALLDGMLADTVRTQLLLGELEAGRIKAAELDPTRVTRLTRHRNQKIRDKAKKLLAAAVPADRQKVIAQYQSALSLKADPNRGRQVFSKNCTACHRIAGLGVDVAPDIADSRTKTPEFLLTSILDPNRAVDSNYFSYTVVTTQGKVLTGLVSAETASSVTLRQQDDKTVVVLRDEIDEMRSNGISLMPVGVEENVSVQQMADLISFIKNWRYLGGRVPIAVGKK